MSASSTSPLQGTAIVLVNWNNPGDAIECLDSLLPTLGEADHVYLVDNASTDGSVGQIVAWLQRPQAQPNWRRPPHIPSLCALRPGQPVTHQVLQADGQPPAGIAPASGASQLSIVHSGGNLGFAGGNNVGLRLALQRPFAGFWLLNTDTVVRADTLAQMWQRLRQNPALGMVGSTLVYYHRPDTVQALGGQLDEHSTCMAHIDQDLPLDRLPQDPADVERRMAYVVGASMLVTRDFVQTVGLMQDDYFLYYEELDWALRARGRFALGYAPGSIVFHKVGGSSAKPASAFSLSMLYRNRIRFVSRFLPQRLGATLRGLAWEWMRHVLKGRWVPARVLGKTLLQRRQLVASAPPVAAGAPR